eukprot:840290_1
MSTFPGFDRPLKQYKVSELKGFLRTRSLKVSGLKKTLISRLRSALKQEAAEAEAEAAKNVHESDDDESMIEQDSPPPKLKPKQNGARSDPKNTSNDVKPTENKSTPKDTDKSDCNTNNSTDSDQDNTNGKPQPSDTNATPDTNQTESTENATKKSVDTPQTKAESIESKTADKTDEIESEKKSECQSIETEPETETEPKTDAVTKPLEPTPKDDDTLAATKTKENDTSTISTPCVPSIDSCVPSVSNTNHNKETTNNEPLDSIPTVDNNNNQQNTDNKQPQKEQKPTETSRIHSEDSRDAQLAAMRARLLRDKLLKQQKSNSQSSSSSPHNAKKRSLRDFEEESHETRTNQSHKRRKLNEKNLEITDQTSPRVTATPSGRIVIDANDANRKLYIPPHQRAEEEEEQSTGLNDNSHDIEFDAKDSITGSALFIDGFRRPLQTKKVEQELIKYGAVKSFKMNAIKSHCYVIFDCNESATACKTGMDKMHFPPNIPQIHAGQLKVRSVRMMEAMNFIQNEEHRTRRLKAKQPPQRSFETKNTRAFDITVETRDDSSKEKEEIEAKTPKSLFKMTECTPTIFWQHADAEQREKNKQMLEEWIAKEKERYTAYQNSKKVEKNTEKKEEIKEPKEARKPQKEHKEQREHPRERRVRDTRDERKSGYTRTRPANNGYFRGGRMQQKRDDFRHFGNRRGGGRRTDYRAQHRHHHRMDRRDRDRRDRERRDRDRRYHRSRGRDRRSRRKFREESESSDDESDSERSTKSRSRSRSSSRSRSRSRSKSRSSSSSSSVNSKRDGKEKRRRDEIPTTTTTTISTLENSAKEASTEFVHPERMNRIENCTLSPSPFACSILCGSNVFGLFLFIIICVVIDVILNSCCTTLALTHCNVNRLAIVFRNSGSNSGTKNKLYSFYFWTISKAIITYLLTLSLSGRTSATNPHSTTLLFTFYHLSLSFRVSIHTIDPHHTKVCFIEQSLH